MPSLVTLQRFAQGMTFDQYVAFWPRWASATVDEIISGLHRKAVLGVV